MRQTFVLIHSPLVGPFTWVPVAEELIEAGHAVIVPSLQDALEREARFGQAMASRLATDLAEAKVQGELQLVARSAAGFFLPAFREALDMPIASYVC